MISYIPKYITYDIIYKITHPTWYHTWYVYHMSMICLPFMIAFPLQCRHFSCSGRPYSASCKWFWIRLVHGPRWSTWLCRSICLSLDHWHVGGRWRRSRCHKRTDPLHSNWLSFQWGLILFRWRSLRTLMALSWSEASESGPFTVSIISYMISLYDIIPWYHINYMKS